MSFFFRTYVLKFTIALKRKFHFRPFQKHLETEPIVENTITHKYTHRTHTYTHTQTQWRKGSLISLCVYTAAIQLLLPLSFSVAAAIAVVAAAVTATAAAAGAAAVFVVI